MSWQLLYTKHTQKDAEKLASAGLKEQKWGQTPFLSFTLFEKKQA